jgi:DNA-binding LacI/PurR family transcriptional regulator
MRTVAQAAGVNGSTVSRALRGAPGASAAVAARIREIARRLGYRTNPLVAALTAQVRTYRRAPHAATIALLDCWPEQRPVWANFDDSLDYMSGIRRRAAALGYAAERVRLSAFDGDLGRLQRFLHTRRMHGLLVLPVPEGTDLSGLDFSRLACATIDFSLERPAVLRRASANYHHNMWLALTTLVARGYRRIGYLTTRIGMQRQDRLGLSAFLAFRIIHPHACVQPCLTDVKRYRQDMARWLERERPDALIASDVELPGDVEATGRRVPEDVACVYFARPPSNPRNLAYLDENYREIGAQAVDMIVDAIHRNDFGLPATLVVHFVDGIWREGSTVRPAAPAEKEGVDRHAGGVPGTSRSHRAPG